MKATYYISFNAVDYTEMFLSNLPKLSLKQEAGEIFFRWNVDSFKIGATLNSAAYATLETWFFDNTKYTTDINYRIKQDGITKFEFIGPILKGKINKQNKVYECTPEADDNYRKIMPNYEVKFLDPSTSIFGIWNRGVADLDLNSNLFYDSTHYTSFTSFVDTAGSVVWSNNAGVIGFSQNIIATAAPLDLVIKITAFSGDSFILRTTDNGEIPVSGNTTISGVGTYVIDATGATKIGAYKNSTAGAHSGTFSYKAYILDNSASDVIYGGTLYDHFIAVLGAARMVTGIADIKSTILWNDALDSSHEPTAIYNYFIANPTKDYVTETAAIFNDLWLMRTDNVATAGDLLYTSFKDIMDYLKIKLRVYWYFDEDGKVRIEHEKYFRSYVSQLDLSSHATAEIDSKVYSYSPGELVKQINYAEGNQSNEDWIPYSIKFTQYISNTIKEVNMNEWGTDFGYVQDNPADASLGYMLLRMIPGNTYPIVSIDESEVTPGTYYMNALMGWYYILYNYHSYFASAAAGFVNNAAYSFDAVKEYLFQDDIKFYSATILDWKKPLTTSLGTAWIREAEYDPETGFYNINVGYDPLKSSLFKMCLIRNKEMDNTLSLAGSTKLVITDKTGVVLTINNLPNYEEFDETGWVAMLCDADKTGTADPNVTGDYLYKYFCTIDRSAKTLTFAAGTVLTAWEVTDNLVLYSPFLNYEFAGDQRADAFISTEGAPEWRDVYTLGGPVFKDSSGVYKWFIMGYSTAAVPLRQTIGYAYSTDMENWTMGNGDAPIIIPADIPVCTGVVISGNIGSLGGGNYYCMLGCNHADGRILLRVVYFNEDFSVITFGDIIFDIAEGLRNIHPSIWKINNEYHLSFYTRTGSTLPTSELTFAKSSTLSGTYTPYQVLVRGDTSNDGTPWSNNVDVSCIFESKGKISCFFGGTSKWAPSGNKGNREFCIAHYNKTSKIWSIDKRSPLIINPLYWANLSADYNWAADHVGSTPSIFVDGGNIYMTCSMNYGTNGYRATIIKLNKEL